MGVPDAEATLVACSAVDGRDGVPSRTSLYREVCELERRVLAVDHLTSLARLARGADAFDDEREKAFAREEPCLGRARELLEVRRACAEAYDTVPAGNWSSRKVLRNTRATRGARLVMAHDFDPGLDDANARGDAEGTRTHLASAATRDVALARILRPLFASARRLGDGPLGARTRSAAIPAAGAAALEALLARVAAEGAGGVRCAGGLGFRDVEAIIGTVERANAWAKRTSRTRGASGAAAEAEAAAVAEAAAGWRAATKRAHAAVAVARAAGDAASSAKGQAYADARAAMGAEEAETRQRVCVKSCGSHRRRRVLAHEKRRANRRARAKESDVLFQL